MKCNIFVFCCCIFTWLLCLSNSVLALLIVLGVPMRIKKLQLGAPPIRSSVNAVRFSYRL